MTVPVIAYADTDGTGADGSGLIRRLAILAAVYGPVRAAGVAAVVLLQNRAFDRADVATRLDYVHALAWPPAFAVAAVASLLVLALGGVAVVRGRRWGTPLLRTGAWGTLALFAAYTFEEVGLSIAHDRGWVTISAGLRRTSSHDHVELGLLAFAVLRLTCDLALPLAVLAALPPTGDGAATARLDRVARTVLALAAAAAVAVPVCLLEPGSDLRLLPRRLADPGREPFNAYVPDTVRDAALIAAAALYLIGVIPALWRRERGRRLVVGGGWLAAAVVLAHVLYPPGRYLAVKAGLLGGATYDGWAAADGLLRQTEYRIRHGLLPAVLVAVLTWRSIRARFR